MHVCTDVCTHGTINVCTQAMSAGVNEAEYMTSGVHAVLFMYVHVFFCMCAPRVMRAARFTTSYSDYWRAAARAAGKQRATGSSSLHTSLFKGAIKVWQKCQCCRQGTGL